MDTFKKYVEKNFEYYFSGFLIILGIGLYGNRTYIIAAICVYFSIVILYFKYRRNSTKDILDRVSDFAFSVLLSAPLIVYVLLLFIDFIKIKYPEYIFLVGVGSDWIGFAGSIIGGAMTMFALVFTIQHEKDLRIKEKIDSLKPFIDIDIEFEKNDRMILNCDRDKNCMELVLNINNISNNNLRDFEIIEITRNSDTNGKFNSLLLNEKNIDDKKISDFGKIGLIKGNDRKWFPLCFDYLDATKIQKMDSRIVNIWLLCKFYDVFGNGPYFHEAYFEIEQNLDKTFNCGFDYFNFKKTKNISISEDKN